MQRTIATLFVSGLLLGGWTVQAQQDNETLEFSAVAISAGGPLSSPVTAQLEIAITRWSTEAERKQLIAALAKGQEQGLDVLARLEPVGSVRTPGNLRWALRYAEQARTEDGGREIFLATDRPMSFSEIAQQPRTTRYPFTVIQLDVNAQGEGQGELLQAVRVRATDDGRIVTLENYTVSPVSLTQVKQHD